MGPDSADIILRGRYQLVSFVIHDLAVVAAMAVSADETHRVQAVGVTRGDGFPPHSSVIILMSSRVVSISENFGRRTRLAVSDTATESNVTDRRPVQDEFPVQSGWIGLPPSYLSEMG